MTLYVLKEHILYNRVDPAQTTLLKVTGYWASLLSAIDLSPFLYVM